MTECVVLVGLPGAGKTTLYNERYGATHRHISKDLLGRVSNKPKRQALLIDRALAEGVPFVVDNTNATRAERAVIVKAAKAAGARVVCCYVEASTREAVARNRTRIGMARVPDVAIFTVARRLEPPTPDEGFDELETIRTPASNP